MIACPYFIWIPDLVASYCFILLKFCLLVPTLSFILLNTHLYLVLSVDLNVYDLYSKAMEHLKTEFQNSTTCPSELALLTEKKFSLICHFLCHERQFWNVKNLKLEAKMPVNVKKHAGFWRRCKSILEGCRNITKFMSIFSPPVLCSAN